jgi:hypothetical protein
MELDHGDVPFDDIYYDDSPTYNDYPSFYSPQQQSYHSFVPSSCLLPRGSQKAKFITHSTKQETVLCNFLKMIGILLRDATSPCSNENDGLANILLRKHPETLRNTLNTLFYCELSTKKPIDAISIESWKCVSLADTILYSLLTMLSSVKNNVDASKQLLEHLINIIRHRDENVLTSLQHNPSYHISTCVVFLLLQMIVNQKYSTAFIELGLFLYFPFYRL